MSTPVKKASTDDKQKPVTVTFVKSHSRYVKGDVAGFGADIAQKLIDRKVAIKGAELPKADGV